MLNANPTPILKKKINEINGMKKKRNHFFCVVVRNWNCWQFFSFSVFYYYVLMFPIVRMSSNNVQYMYKYIIHQTTHFFYIFYLATKKRQQRKWIIDLFVHSMDSNFGIVGGDLVQIGWTMHDKDFYQISNFKMFFSSEHKHIKIRNSLWW